MSPNDAIPIIESLANGIDPETGEVLSGQSVFSQPQVIRALFVVLKGLDRFAKNESRNKRLPENAGKPWLGIEDSELILAWGEGRSVKEIATKHCRTIGSIASRLTHLGCVKERQDAYLRP
jgi:hypothetical protein